MINYSTFAKLRGIKHSMEHAILKYNEHTLSFSSEWTTRNYRNFPILTFQFNLTFDCKK